jgi:hypothetical protein
MFSFPLPSRPVNHFQVKPQSNFRNVNGLAVHALESQDMLEPGVGKGFSRRLLPFVERQSTNKPELIEGTLDQDSAREMDFMATHAFDRQVQDILHMTAGKAEEVPLQLLQNPAGESRR